MDDKNKQQKIEQSEILSEAEGKKEEIVEEESEEESKDSVLLQQLEELDQKYKRALADYANLQRRTREEKSEWARLSNKELVLKLLPILDTLMLAEKHTKDQNFVLTVNQFLQVLKDEGISRIKTVGEKFDPMLMEAVETRKGKEHEVLEEVKAGFILGETVLRPALVVVGKE